MSEFQQAVCFKCMIGHSLKREKDGEKKDRGKSRYSVGLAILGANSCASNLTMMDDKYNEAPFSTKSGLHTKGGKIRYFSAIESL